MVRQFGYSGYEDGVLERISGLAQVAQADRQKLQKQFEQTNRLTLSAAADMLKYQSAAADMLKRFEQNGRALRQVYEAGLIRGALDFKGLEIQPQLFKEPLKLSLLLGLQPSPRLRSDTENSRKSPSSTPRLNPVVTTVLRQTPNLPQQKTTQSYSPTVKNKPTFRSHAKEQKRVLIAIYRRLEGGQEEFIKWQPSAWFGKDVISQSDRAKWSNTLRSLVEKGLIKLHDPDDRRFRHNRGNAKICILLTSEGYQTVKQLMQND